MEESKYYCPEIIDFHVGFEYEYKAPIGWVKEKLGWQNLDDISDLIYMKQIRVKYIDKEDICSLGWYGCSVLDYKEKEHDFVEGFEIGNGKISFILQKVECNTYAIWRRDCYNEHSGNWTSQDIFFGTIKNKSELVRLMNQLNIK
jgi:hypothetical protein